MLLPPSSTWGEAAFSGRICDNQSVVEYISNFRRTRGDKERGETNRWPGQVAVTGLPSPLSEEAIGPSVLRAPEAIVQEPAIPRLIQRITLVPHPVPIENVALGSLLAQKFNSFDPCLSSAPQLLPHQSPPRVEPFRESPVVVQVQEAADDDKRQDEEQAHDAHVGLH